VLWVSSATLLGPERRYWRGEVNVITASVAPARTTRAAVFAAVAVVLALALRAHTDGPRPATLVIAAAFVFVFVVARPLTARERRLPAVLIGLLGAQLALHAGFLLASTGRLTHTGSAGLFCSPAAPDGATSSSCLATDRGGLLLLLVQLLAALVFAGWIRGVDSAAWLVVRTVARNLTVTVAGWLLTLLAALADVVPAIATSGPPRDRVPRRPAALLFARSHGRRGPPTWRAPASAHSVQQAALEPAALT
jgi:hypothetical protein